RHRSRSWNPRRSDLAPARERADPSPPCIAQAEQDRVLVPADVGTEDDCGAFAIDSLDPRGTKVNHSAASPTARKLLLDLDGHSPQALIGPKVMPRTKKRWIRNEKTIIGAIPSTLSAACGPHSSPTASLK